MPVTLTGHVDRFTFQAEDTGWTVARVTLEDGRGVTAVGYLVGINPGEHVELVGEWTHHPRFGPQLKILRVQPVVPATVDGIRKYLASGILKGIGPVTAERIVDAFGEATLAVMDKEPDRLAEVEGIGSKRVEMIKAAWNRQHEGRELMMFLREHDIGPALAARIYKEYGNRAMSIIRKNPYRLATDIYGVGFRTADRLAQRLGFDLTSVLRAEAGVLYALQALSEEGHVCYPLEALLKRCVSLLEIDADTIERAVRGLVDRGWAALEELGTEDPPLVYLKRLYLAERGVCQGIMSLLSAENTVAMEDWESLERWAEGRLDLVLAPEQREAVRAALSGKVTIITGGPGTGKTTLVKAILEIMKKKGRTVLLTAPTGRAAKRLALSSGQEAKTIHRLLEFSPNELVFKRDEEHPLRTDALIVDETSMVDVSLMNSLLSSLPPGTVLVLVGDAEQLPSVGPGCVLKDIIESKTVPVIRLNQIHRQAEQSLIVVNAHRINAGKWPLMQTEVQDTAPDWYFIERTHEEKILDLVMELCSERLKERFGLDPANDVQVLTPMNRGPLGVLNLNLRLQEVLNPGELEVKRGESGFRTGDKVMQLRNNYEREVFNGDIGRILSVDREEGEVRVDFEGRVLSYALPELDELSLAYAISVHKSQGSEYAAVVCPIALQHYMLLQRNLLYTAITRGKKLVVLVGQKRALQMAIQNDRTRRRYSFLKERLMDARKKSMAGR